MRLLAFARLRELLGESQDVELHGAPSAQTLWASLCEDSPELAHLHRSTRVAVNGALVRWNHPLQDGDEVAFLPPVGGG